jgi:hypothetical protein
VEYSVVYDVTQEAPALWFPAFGLLFVAIGALLWRYGDRTTSVWRGSFRERPGLRRGFAGFFLGFSVLWTVVSGVSILGSYFGPRRALSDGSARVVEGVVEDFHPMPKGGHDTERFTVGGVRFEYSDFIVSPGFNRTSSHGGPIREGLHVRIHYSLDRGDATILKLEIKP